MAPGPVVTDIYPKDREAELLATEIALTRAEELTNTLGMKLQLLEAGRYERGERDPKPGFSKDHTDFNPGDDRPVHPVVLTKPFYLATTEVTRGQFREFVEATGYVTTADATPVYGARRLYTHINRFAVRYIFKTDLSLAVAARHYWLTGRYRGYFALTEEGDYPDFPDYGGQHDFSYNAFNVDLLFSWRFAPGSTLSVSYKNAIEYDLPLPCVCQKTPSRPRSG